MTFIFSTHLEIRHLWELKCVVGMSCQSDEKSAANHIENISVWENNHNGHLNDLVLSFYICHQYFLQQPILLPTPSLICSNTLSPPPLSLSLCYLALSPQLSHWVFNPVMSNNHDHWINAFCKELFSFLRVAPTWNKIVIFLHRCLLHALPLHILEKNLKFLPRD